MNLISPDEEDILSGILDEGINEIRQSKYILIILVLILHQTKHKS